MANPHVDKIVGHYGSLAERWLDRWRRILSEGRAGSYTANAWAVDTVRTWGDVTSSVRLAVEFIDPPWLIPDMNVSITHGDAEALGAVALPDPGVVLVASTLDATDNPTAKIPVANIELLPVSSAGLLVVRLRQMDQTPVRTLLTPPGRVFTGEVHAQGNPGDVKARIILTVV